MTLAYTGARFDRAGILRRDPGWVRSTQDRPDTRIVPLWREMCLVSGTTPVILPGSWLPAEAEPVLLGLDGAVPHFAVDLSGYEQDQAIALAGAERAVELRRIVQHLDATRAAMFAQARGLLYWHRQQRYCGRCGGVTAVAEAGHQRVCRSCGTVLFPRIEPAVIALVEAPGPPGRCLLGRHRGAGEGNLATIAGFVEIGESLEDAVRREVREETGVVVGEVAYQASQPWPFPAGVMLGFRARALSEEITVDADELIEAHWFTRAQVHAQLQAWRRASGRERSDSIEHHLLETWLAEGGDHHGFRPPDGDGTR